MTMRETRRSGPSSPDPPFWIGLEAELQERAAEAKGSLRDSLRYVHVDWIRGWLKNK